MPQKMGPWAIPIGSFVSAMLLAFVCGPAANKLLARAAGAPTCDIIAKPCEVGALISREVFPKGALGANFQAGNGFWTAELDVLAEPSSVSMETTIATAGTAPVEHKVPQNVFTRLIHRAEHKVSGATPKDESKKLKLQQKVEGIIQFADNLQGDSFFAGEFQVDLELAIPQATPNKVRTPIFSVIAIIPFGQVSLYQNDTLERTFQTASCTVPQCTAYNGTASVQDNSEWRRLVPNPRGGNPPQPSERAIHFHFITDTIQCTEE